MRGRPTDDPWIAQEGQIMQLRFWMRAQGIGPSLTQEQIRRQWTLIGELEEEVVEAARSGDGSPLALAQAFGLIDQAVMVGRISIAISHHVACRILLQHPALRECIEANRAALHKTPRLPRVLEAVIDPRGAADSFVFEHEPLQVQ